MNLSLNPTTFDVRPFSPELVEAGWKEVEPSPCGRWLEVKSEMISRAIFPSGGQRVEIICLHVKTRIPGQGPTVIGRFETDKSRAEAAIAAAAMLERMGLPLDLLVFHVDQFEFGTRHGLRKQGSNLILAVDEAEVMA